MRLLNATGVWLASVLASSGTAAAQPPLTIGEAVQQAIDRNLTLVAERYSVSVAQARVLTASLRPNPVFTYSAMVPDSTIYQSATNPLENVFRTDVVLESAGKRAKRIEVAAAAKSVAELQLLNTMRTLVLDVESAFIDVMVAADNLALARESLNAFDELVQVNTERVRTGDLSQVELARSRLAALQFQNDVRQRASRLTIARTRLATLLGRSSGEPLEVSGDFPRPTAQLSVDEIRARALELRPDLQALRRDKARSAADLRLQIAQGKVDYTVSGEVHLQKAPRSVFGNEYGLYVSVPVPIFNRNQGEVERATLEQQQSDARLRALELQVDGEVRSAFEAYTAARDVVGTIETVMLAQARDVRATTEYAYRRGEASFIEFLDAVRAFNDTMQSYSEARGDFARSLYTLESISGTGSTEVTP